MTKQLKSLLHKKLLQISEKDEHTLADKMGQGHKPVLEKVKMTSKHGNNIWPYSVFKLELKEQENNMVFQIRKKF